MKKDVIVYTAITEGYDDLKMPYSISDRCHYVCFTDDPSIQGNGLWEIKPFPNPELDQVRKCRQLKILPHIYFTEYQYSIWIDGNIQITADIDELIETYFDQSDQGFFSFAHPWRDCIYDEAEDVIENRKGIEDSSGEKRARKQMEKYKLEGMTKNNGLIESNVILRKHTPEVNQIMEQWWEEVKTHSRRDQLSFNYVAWKNDFEYGLLEGCSRWNTNKYFSITNEHPPVPPLIDESAVK